MLVVVNLQVATHGELVATDTTAVEPFTHVGPQVDLPGTFTPKALPTKPTLVSCPPHIPHTEIWGVGQDHCRHPNSMVGCCQEESSGMRLVFWGKKWEKRFPHDEMQLFVRGGR